jgi:hypothetical protein
MLFVARLLERLLCTIGLVPKTMKTNKHTHIKTCIQILGVTKCIHLQLEESK